MRNKWTTYLSTLHTHDYLNLRIFRQGEHCICSGNGLAMSALYPEMRWGVLLMCCSPTFLDYSAFWMKILVRWESVEEKSLSFKILPLEVSPTTPCVNKIDKDWIQNPANIFRLAFSPPNRTNLVQISLQLWLRQTGNCLFTFFCLFIPFLPGKTSESWWPLFCITLWQNCNGEGNIQV